MNSKTLEKLVHNFLDSELEDKHKVAIWQDVINISMALNESNGFRPLSVPELITRLKTLENRLRAPVYCKRERRPNVIEELKNQRITVLNVEKDFCLIPKARRSRIYETVPCINNYLGAEYTSQIIPIKNYSSQTRYGF